MPEKYFLRTNNLAAIKLVTPQSLCRIGNRMVDHSKQKSVNPRLRKVINASIALVRMTRSAIEMKHKVTEADKSSSLEIRSDMEPQDNATNASRNLERDSSSRSTKTQGIQPAFPYESRSGDRSTRTSSDTSSEKRGGKQSNHSIPTHSSCLGGASSDNELFNKDGTFRS